MTALVDTNVLVYRYDSRFPEKQATATELLRRGLVDETLRLPHQALLEFVAATTWRRSDASPILDRQDALREAEELALTFPVLYPDESVLRTAIRGAATYQLSWFDAHLWAYAECHGLDTIWSEDFEHGRRYGRVRVLDPFQADE